MNNIDIKYNVHNYTETHKQMQTILQQKQLISKENGTINFTMNGGKEVVKEIKDIIEYSKELKRQLNDVGKNSKLGQQLEQEIKRCDSAINKLKQSINKWGTEADKAAVEQIKSYDKIIQKQEQIAKKDTLKKQQENQVKAAEQMLDTWQDAYRKLQKAEADMLKGKKVTPSEYSYVKKTFELADAELNKMSKDVQSFSGKFKGAADVAKQFSKHMKDAQQFTIDNTKETIARDELTELEKEYDKLQQKKEKLISTQGEDSTAVKKIAQEQEKLTQEIDKQYKVLEEALELDRNRGNLDDKGLQAAKNRLNVEKERRQTNIEINNLESQQNQRFQEIKAQENELYNIESKLTQLQKDPKKHTSEIQYLKRLLANKKNQYDLENKINKLPAQQREEIEKIIQKHKEANAQLKEQNKDWKNNKKSATELGDTIKKVFNYVLVYRFFYMLQQGINKALETMKELDKAFTDIQMVTGDTDEQTAQLAQDYNQLAKEMGSTTKEVAEGAAEWFNESRDHLKTLELLETRED